ncbi:unnamed protein product [Allacma fusca]|uniref:G-protein coupled receptor Mth2 n=1 Tax=Allacma fusca TaxID=39272 RepID=A0A8J2KHW3_9HEXA|nr:unnamed protein product [Allacma fusca]
MPLGVKRVHHPTGTICWMVLFLLSNIFFRIACGQWTQIAEDLSGKEHPFVNKCCHFNQSYENGGCVETGYRMDEDKRWKPPKTMIYEDNSTELADYPVVFRLLLAQPNCKNGVIEKIILNPPRQRRNADGSTETYEINHPDVVLSPQGSLIWTDENNFTNTYQYENFCIDQVNKTAFVAVVCKPMCNEETPCIRKCCKPEDLLDVGNQTCVPAHTPWNPHLYSSNLTNLTRLDDSSLSYIVGVPRCQVYIIDMRKEKSEKFYALSNGSLMTVLDDKKHVFSNNKFCVDGVAETYVGDLDYQHFYDIAGHSGLESDQIAVICLDGNDNDEEQMSWIFPLFAGVMSISAIFLILTAAVYLILWEYQNIHGWLQFSYVVSLLFAFSFLAFVQLFSPYILYDYPEICEFFGSVIHFSFLSAFFWLTSMNFDLWWTFSGCRPLRASTRTGEKKRFAFFGLLSWGCAILIASTGVALDSAYKGDPVISEFLPQFGTKNCYFHNERSKLPFFYAPIGFLLCVNVIFFMSTILSLHKLQKDTRFATRQSSNQDKKRFVLFLKLFVLMGVCWVFEMISWLSVLLSPENEHTLKLAFLFTDILNALQGVFIFIIFTCKPNTCKQLEGQFKKLSVRLEESRDKTSESDSRVARFFAIGFCAVILPIVHGFRKLFSYCGRPTRSLEGRRTISHNTVTSTFEKSRKASDSSACTTLSVVDAGTYEMDTTY